MDSSQSFLQFYRRRTRKAKVCSWRMVLVVKSSPRESVVLFLGEGGEELLLLDSMVFQRLSCKVQDELLT